MKIAFIIELTGTKRQGGEQHAMLNVAESIRRKGNTVDVYSYTSSDENLKVTSAIPLSMRLLPFIRDMFFVPVVGKSLLEKIDKKYDCIVASSTTLTSFYKPKTKYITICHIIRSQKFETLKKIPKYRIFFNPFSYALMMKREKESLSHSDTIVVIREHQKDYLTNVFKIPKEKIQIIPNGINTDLFKPLKVTKKNQIIFVGRGTVPKGLDTLLKAIDSIDSHLLIVTQKIDDDLRDLAESKSNASIIYNAKPNELVKHYSESKIFILPSLDEEQPLTTLEAMACGLPVVVSPKAASDIVEDEINGLIAHDLQSLVEGCNTLLKNEILLSAMSKNNRDKIRSHYSIEKTTSQIAALL